MTHARSALYDLILLAHVLAVFVSLVILALAAASAWRLSQLAPDVPVPEVLARYYRPGINWAGRMIMAVPVFGVALVAMSHGDWSFSDTWVIIGMAIWLAAAGISEAVVWPAERELQASLAGDAPEVDRPAKARLIVRCALGLEVVLVATSIIMVAKPG